MAVWRCGFLGLWLLLCAISATAAPAPKPNIILITLDTTRADRMGFLGSTRGLTPNLDALARDGLIFTRAYSHVPLTTASHTTILTGTYPQFNHVNDFGVPLSPRLPYLPDILHHQGYHTGAFVGSLILDPLDGTAPGFDRGFDVYDANFHLRRHGADRYQSVERRAGVVVDHALGWLSHLENGPFFLWVHVYDAHDPYDPPPPFKAKYASAPYDGEIAYVDSALGKLFDQLRKHGLLDETLIAVMADHGESLGAHGENTHGVFLYDETLHVPLLIKLPLEHAAKRIETRAGLVDVAPTILDAAGLAVPAEMQGESLLGIAGVTPLGRPQAGGRDPSARSGKAAAAAVDRPEYAETDYPHRAFGWSALRALRTGKYLYIQAPDRELYNQAADPNDAHNLAAASKAVADTLNFQLDEFRKKTSQTMVELAKPDPEQMKKLQALGYVGSDATESSDDKKLSGVDPKKRIEVSNLLHDAMFDVEDARYEQAIPLLEKALAEQPDMPVANMQYGMAQERLKNYAKALAPLQKAVALQPDNGMGHYELGLTLFETGDWKGAAPQFEAAVARAPRWADAHFSLAAVYARIDRVPEAMTELDTTLSLSPDHYRANLLRGRILSLQGEPAAALDNLLKAAAVEPNSREAHLFLADAYDQLGRQLDAQRERGKAEGLGAAKR
ncbi:MAG TPA: sulfatase-like hydrolase/transferase [Terriglobales bacterium]|nr:sulfatase-like hydrolase/transferase [Terriglobales bacterium]